MFDFQKTYSWLKGKVPWKLVIFLAIFIFSWILYGDYTKQRLAVISEDSQPFLNTIAKKHASESALGLMIEPDNGIAYLQKKIAEANHSLDLVIYELEDPQIEQALADASLRGVQVKVILQDVNTFGKHPNQDAYNFLQKNKVPVHWAKDYFALTHQKTLIVDQKSAVIMTFNLVPKYYDSSRDFAVIDNNPKDVEEISSVFEADWEGKGIQAGAADDLVWSPGSFPLLKGLIDHAQHSLDIYNEEMADPRIIQALQAASQRGVQVRVVMTYATNWKQVLKDLSDKGVQVHTYAAKASLYIHAKMIAADDTLVFIGSENFSNQSLDANRELGVMLSRKEIISDLENTFNSDWQGARPFASSEDTVIKLSSSGICHSPGDASYEQTKKFTPFDTLQACVAAGGKLPKHH